MDQHVDTGAVETGWRRLHPLAEDDMEAWGLLQDTNEC